MEFLLKKIGMINIPFMGIFWPKKEKNHWIYNLFFCFLFFWFALKISQQVPNFTPEKKEKKEKRKKKKEKKKAAPNPTLLGDICEVIMGFY